MKDEKERLGFKKLQIQLAEMEATQWSKELELEARRQSVEDGKGEVRGGLRGQGNAHLQGDSREGGLDEAGEE